ncbi:hypothetical protein BH23CHL2_BH23CHL2_00950 [soil metagenome]
MTIAEILVVTNIIANTYSHMPGTMPVPHALSFHFSRVGSVYCTRNDYAPWVVRTGDSVLIATIEGATTVGNLSPTEVRLAGL